MSWAAKSQQIRNNAGQLAALGLLQRTRPPGVGALPVPGNPWQPVSLGSEVVFVHESVLRALALNQLPLYVAAASTRPDELRRRLRKSGRRALLLMTVFLPVVLTHVWPTPTYPGSRNTMGMALTGFVAFLCIPGFILGVARGNWLLAWTCVYWWMGAFLLAGEYRSRGFDV